MSSQIFMVWLCVRWVFPCSFPVQKIPDHVTFSCHGPMVRPSILYLETKWHVRVRKESCKQANHLILWGRWSTKIIFFLDFSFFLKKLKKYDLTRPKVSKYSLTSRPEVIVVFHGQYKRTVTHTLKISHFMTAFSSSSCMEIVSLCAVWTYVFLGIWSLLIIWWSWGITRLDVGYWVSCIRNVLS